MGSRALDMKTLQKYRNFEKNCKEQKNVTSRASAQERKMDQKWEINM